MKKLLYIVMVCMLLVSCSSKTITTNPRTGETKVETKSDASAFSDAQAEAWKGYYEALKNPPVIATITDENNKKIEINSQVPPPPPVIRQHQNQYIQPITGMVKTGIKVIGGGLVVREIVDSMQGTNITNAGAGTVTVDRSESVSVETHHAEGASTLNQDSNNDSSDNHVENANPTITEQEKVVIVEPEVVNPEVVIVEPAYPPVNE